MRYYKGGPNKVSNYRNTVDLIAYYKRTGNITYTIIFFVSVSSRLKYRILRKNI